MKPDTSSSRREEEGDTDISRRRERILRMVGVQSVGTVVTLVDRYALVPLFLAYWGLSVYGAWLLIRVIPTYISMLELGISSAVGNRLTVLGAEERHTEAASLYRLASRMMIWISVTVTVLAGILVVLVDMRPALNLSDLTASDLSWSLFLMVAYTAGIFQSQVLYAAYRKDDRQVIWNIGVQSIRIMELVAVCMAVIAGWGLVGVSASYVVIRLIGVGVLSVYARRHLSALTRAPVAHIREFRGLLAPSLGFLLFPLAQAFNIQAIIWGIGYRCGADSAATFNILRVYSRLVFQFGQIANRSTLPDLSRLIADRDWGAVKRLLRTTTVLTFLSAIVGAVVAFALASLIIPIWTGGHIESDAWVIGLLLGSCILASCWYALYTLPMAEGSNLSTALLYLGVSCAGAAVVAVAAPTPFGAAMTVISMEGTMFAWMVLRVHKWSDQHAD